MVAITNEEKGNSICAEELSGGKNKSPDTFRENIDGWVKQINHEFEEIRGVTSIVSEHQENIQHNYELIYELKDEVEEMQHEMRRLRLLITTIHGIAVRLEKQHMEDKTHGKTNKCTACSQA